MNPVNPVRKPLIDPATGKVAVTGYCAMCRYRGILRPKTMMDGRDYHVCITCWETPLGCVSENLKARKGGEGEGETGRDSDTQHRTSGNR